MGEVPPPSPLLGRKLESHPDSKGISNICFSHKNDFLLVSSWDAKLRLHDVFTDVLKACFQQSAPILDCCFDCGSSCITGSIDKSVCKYDLQEGKMHTLGRHHDAVSCVEYFETVGTLATGSWDKTVKFWDHRDATRVMTRLLHGRVFSISLIGHRLVVATHYRNIFVYDYRRMEKPEQIREHVTVGYALSSMEGSVALEYFDTPGTSQAKKYVFRPVTVDGRDTTCSVNALALHPRHGMITTGCSGGYVNIWDGKKQKCIYKTRRYPTSISALSFDRDGLLAVASSHTHDEDDTPRELDAIFVTKLYEAEV